jgi:hypothetical protein
MVVCAKETLQNSTPTSSGPPSTTLNTPMQPASAFVGLQRVDVQAGHFQTGHFQTGLSRVRFPEISSAWLWQGCQNE